VKVHNQISRGDVTNAVQRALGITKPDTAGVERYSETLTPVQDIWSQPEWSFLRGERLQGFAGNVGAIAAEFGYSALINPAGSNVLVVVTVAVGRLLAYNLQIGQEATYAATLAAVLPGGIFRDTRWPVSSLGGSARIRTGTDPSGTLGTTIEFGTNGTPAVNLPVVLAPGWGVALAGVVVNTALDYVWGWRERKAYPGELGTP